MRDKCAIYSSMRKRSVASMMPLIRLDYECLFVGKPAGKGGEKWSKEIREDLLERNTAPGLFRCFRFRVIATSSTGDC